MKMDKKLEKKLFETFDYLAKEPKEVKESA